MKAMHEHSHQARWDQRIALFIWWYVSIVVSIYCLCGFGVKLYEWFTRTSVPERPLTVLTAILFLGGLPLVWIAFRRAWLPGTGAKPFKTSRTSRGALQTPGRRS